MSTFLIGEVAAQTGVPAPTIRYYESIGLLSQAARSRAGYRRYSEAAVEDLRFVRKAQALGFSLPEVREILQLTRAGTAPCSHVLSLVKQHLATVDGRIEQLRRFRAQLASIISKWEGKPARTGGGHCRIIESADAAVQPVEFERPQRLKATKGASR